MTSIPTLLKRSLFLTSVAFSAISTVTAQPSNRAEQLGVPPALDAPKPDAFDGPIIQLALLLDTSNSMDGLIDQARSRLWKIVNEIGEARIAGVAPQFQVSIFHYGNDGLPKKSDHVQLRAPFTTDLDIISEQLFSLSTNGGQEYCGAVLRECLSQLDWEESPDDNTLQLIIIAGNEPFNQGTEPYQEWTAAAKKRGILINTVFCGNIEEGRKTLWADAANQSGGTYASIDQNQTEIQIPTPFDDVLERLNDSLNGTYLGYGSKGKKAKERQLAQDKSNSTASKNSFFSRMSTKTTANYSTSSWDIVSAVEEGQVKIKDLKENDLPEELASLEKEELEETINNLAAERKRIQKEISAATINRENFLNKALKEKADEQNGQDLDDVLIEAIKEQAESKGFTFE
ncbi:VWA domain-containing protein [Puniceicoccaceae bacterium K14]|nr:VWA domain-containing protein [Puniceicoccaceae bacterium K14]